MKTDEEFRSLIPPLTPEERSGLEELLLKEGIRDALVVWQEKDILLDGHTRLDIAEKHGLSYKTVSVSLPSRNAAKGWIIINQFSRRNLDLPTRARLALKAKPILKEAAEERQKLGVKLSNNLVPLVGQGSPKGRTDHKLAKLAGIGHGTLHQMSVVSVEGSADLNRRVDSKEITIKGAYEEVRMKKQDKPVVIKNGNGAIAEIHQMTQDGKTNAEIASSLTERKIPRLNGTTKPWTYNDIYNAKRLYPAIFPPSRKDRSFPSEQNVEIGLKERLESAGDDWQKRIGLLQDICHSIVESAIKDAMEQHIQERHPKKTTEYRT